MAQGFLLFNVRQFLNSQNLQGAASAKALSLDGVHPRRPKAPPHTAPAGKPIAARTRNLNALWLDLNLPDGRQIINPLPALRRPFRRTWLVRPVARSNPAISTSSFNDNVASRISYPSAFSARPAIRTIA